MPTLLIITGPTAVGKTELCLGLAERMGIPVIGADSRQLYRGLEIGTAAPTAKERMRVPHLLVGTLDIGDYYNASMYEQDSLAAIGKSFGCGVGDRALLAGGSMMYIDCVCKGIDDIPTVRDDIRDGLKARLAQNGLDDILEELRQRDPDYYNIVDKHNPRRVLHGLEICIQTGGTYTSLRRREPVIRPFRIVKLALTRPREELYDRINQRVLDMVNAGLEDEARRHYSQRHTNALNTVGYKEMFDYIDGSIPFAEAVRRIQSNTREYARKQLTWLRRDKTVQWIDISRADHSSLVDSVLRYYDNPNTYQRATNDE